MEWILIIWLINAPAHDSYALALDHIKGFKDYEECQRAGLLWVAGNESLKRYECISQTLR